jgi:hypothetical protein
VTTPLRRTRRGPSGRYLLLLVALCLRIPTDCIAGILRHRSEASTRQLLARVSAAGLISFERARAGSVLGGGAFRMWFLTKTGVRAVTDLAETEPSCALLDGVTFTNSRRRRGIVPLVAAYRALAASSATFASRPIIRVWEQPWVRWYQSSADRVVRVRLPASVVLESSTAVLQPIVLLPDTGTRPVASYRTTLRRFGELERQSRGDELPYLMIVLLEAADCEARAAAWSGFIARHLGPGYARVISETRVRNRWMISRAETPRNLRVSRRPTRCST